MPNAFGEIVLEILKLCKKKRWIAGEVVMKKFFFYFFFFIIIIILKEMIPKLI